MQSTSGGATAARQRMALRLLLGAQRMGLGHTLTLLDPVQKMSGGATAPLWWWLGNLPAQRMVVGKTLTLLGSCAEDEWRCDCGALAEALRVLPGAQRMVVGHTLVPNPDPTLMGSAQRTSGGASAAHRRRRCACCRARSAWWSGTP